MTLAELYPFTKATHVALAIASGALFAGRGIGVLLGATMPTSKAMRRTSQVIDTALLAAAIVLLATLGLHPVTTPWIATKLVLLAAYIVLGIFALRLARTTGGRTAAFVGALACYLAIFTVARTHDPWGPLRLLGLAA